MPRSPALVPLSHDHHHGLVAARRARRAAAAGEGIGEAAAALAGYVEGPGREHFREEEELLLPLFGCHAADGSEPAARIAGEHAALRAAAARLRRSASADDLDAAGRLLERHIRFEERELFPLIERVVPEQELAALRLPERVPPATAVAADLTASGTGTLWAAASDDLNATLVGWPPGGGVAAHRNEERDVLYVVVAGAGELTVDGRPVELSAGTAVLVAKGCERSARAGPQGLRYLTAHLRRSGLAPLRRRQRSPLS